MTGRAGESVRPLARELAIVQPEHVERRQAREEGHGPGGVDREQRLLVRERAAEQLSNDLAVPLPELLARAPVLRIDELERGQQGQRDGDPGACERPRAAGLRVELRERRRDDQREADDDRREVPPGREHVAPDRDDVDAPDGDRHGDPAHAAGGDTSARQRRGEPRREQHERRQPDEPCEQVAGAQPPALRAEAELHEGRVRHPLAVVREPERELRQHGERGKQREPRGERERRAPAQRQDPERTGADEQRAVRPRETQKRQQRPRREPARARARIERREQQDERPGEERAEQRRLEPRQRPDRGASASRERERARERRQHASRAAGLGCAHHREQGRESAGRAERSRRAHEIDAERAEPSVREHPEQVRVALHPLAGGPAEPLPFEQPLRVAQRDEGVVCEKGIGERRMREESERAERRRCQRCAAACAGRHRHGHRRSGDSRVTRRHRRCRIRA